jgi:hypothetical protein
MVSFVVEGEGTGLPRFVAICSSASGDRRPILRPLPIYVSRTTAKHHLGGCGDRLESQQFFFSG